MPNSNAKKMDKKDLAQYKKVLVDMKEKISAQIKQMSSNDEEKSGDVSGHALHMADVATDMYDREFSLGLASFDRELLYKIDGAIQRILENKFGLCSECSKPIPIARLKAIPYTETCLKCQEKIESR